MPPRVNIRSTEAARIFGPTDAAKTNRVAYLFRDPKREAVLLHRAGVENGANWLEILSR
jgi:hypothetical protein